MFFFVFFSPSEISPSSPSISGCESSQSLTPMSDSTPPFVGLKVRTPPVSSPSTLSIKDWLKKPVNGWNSVNSPESRQIEMHNLIDEEQNSPLMENSSLCSSQLVEKRKNSAKRKLEGSYTASTCQSPSKQRNVLRTPNWENPKQQENSNRSNLLKSPEKNSLSSKCLFPDGKQIKDQLVDMENTPTNTEISFCERTQSEKDSGDSKSLANSPGYSVFDVLRSPGHSPLHSRSSKRTPKSARSNRKPLQKGSPEVKIYFLFTCLVILISLWFSVSNEFNIYHYSSCG